MASRYFTWTVSQLKKELGRRNAVTNGRKIDLVQRLESYDRNQDFKSPAVHLPDPLEVTWPASGFQQLMPSHRQQLPKLTREQIEAYFLHRLAGDNESARDIKSIKNGELLYASQRVLACSMLVKEDIFFTGIVSAAMKNKVTYNYKLSIKEKTGDVLCSHCECPAGKGSNGTCKHLAAVMVMLEKFTDTGELEIERTCTENLMMFNRPKHLHKGYPVKAEDLNSKRKSSDFLHDPRPEKYRKMQGYQDRVRNLLINYTAQTSANIAFRYL
ncbi:uncharacterized protein LOC117316737 [Pecten maximus]|uniref:uncharacterized protein LOC117316737 n=1 Tax=Pecten maximus TaxID=6579 RepID=UPI001458F568|nr:uncharacterized protein LOC117316737 [Pecten maximus]